MTDLPPFVVCCTECTRERCPRCLNSINHVHVDKHWNCIQCGLEKIIHRATGATIYRLRYSQFGSDDKEAVIWYPEDNRCEVVETGAIPLPLPLLPINITIDRLKKLIIFA